MGMYDTVLVECPNCGEEHHFQSKSGECMLQSYDLESCPDDVLANVNRHAPYKCECGLYISVDVKTRIAYTDAESHDRHMSESEYWKMRALSAEKLIEMEPSDPKTYDEFCRLRDEWRELKNQEPPPY